MSGLLELLLGLPRGFLGREGAVRLDFNPVWPLQQWVGAATWNVLAIAGILALASWVYRRETRRPRSRWLLGSLRAALLLVLLAMLNRPVVTLTQTRSEPSVLPVLVDASLSMRIRDAGEARASRFEAALDLLGGGDAPLLRDLAGAHVVRLYRFGSTATPLPEAPDAEAALAAARVLEPQEQATRVAASARDVLDDLRGQRVAGVVLLSDGRDMPPLAAGAGAPRGIDARVYAVPLGSAEPPSNVRVESVVAQDTLFMGDILNVRATLRGDDLGGDLDVDVRLLDRATGAPLAGPDGGDAARRVSLVAGEATVVELQHRPSAAGPLDVLVRVDPLPAEIDEQDNERAVQVDVLDATIAVLYVEGPPRWEYRFLKNEMIRDPTVEISCLLTSADPAFLQEGDRPITRFPENLEELLRYDVVLFGDVDPRQFSDAQLELVRDFVGNRGGGFGMVAGPLHAPFAYRNSPIEPLLPVVLGERPPPQAGSLADGFRPALTPEGMRSAIFRFLVDPDANARFVAEGLQPIFWYCRNVSAKPGVGRPLAEHPAHSGPDGLRAPLLVFGRYGAGVTMFSAIDDSWRWRFYTGESVFSTYWVQQLRELARGKRLGERRATLIVGREVCELGEQVRLTLRVIDPGLLASLPAQVRLDVLDDQQPGAARPLLEQVMLARAGAESEYVGSFAATRIGRLAVRVGSLGSGLDPIERTLQVVAPRQELADARADRAALQRLAEQTGGRLIEAGEAADALRAIPSAARTVSIESGEPLWNAPLVMGLLVSLITLEWACRKVLGLI